MASHSKGAGLMSLVMRAVLALVAVVCAGAVVAVIGTLMAVLPPPVCPRNPADAALVAQAQATLEARGQHLLCLYDDYGRLTEERYLRIPVTPVPTVDLSHALGV